MILDERPCRPFCASRSGLNLGEAAGYVVLQREDTLGAREPYCQLAGYANANDAFHQTATSQQGEGPYFAMQRAMKKAGMTPGDIDLVCAHGTGTVNNDLTEATAMQRIFGNSMPLFTSTKGNTGHTLGASGGLESVFSALMMRHQEVYPTLGFKSPIPQEDYADEKRLHCITPVTVYQKTPLRVIMKNAFGFGGNATSLIFANNGTTWKTKSKHT